MELDFILQPFADELSLHEVLSAALRERRFTRLDAVVAWTKGSALERLQDDLHAFKQRGGTTSRLITGLDEGGATEEGLSTALRLFDEVQILFDAASGTFHPKVYMVSGSDAATLVIGSNNMTPGGLYFNYEVASVLQMRLHEPGSPDLAAFNKMRTWMDRLAADGTVRALTTDLLKHLTAGPSPIVGSERREPGASGAGERRPSPHYKRLQALFGRSDHRKKPDPRGRLLRIQQPEQPRTVERAPGNHEVVWRWTKQLSRSDSNRPASGSQTTAALRFVKAGQLIDQTTWFRHGLFDIATWRGSAGSTREDAVVPFEVTVGGANKGVHYLHLTHDPTREAGQGNFTTDLKWGTVLPALRAYNALGDWVTVERYSDGTYGIDVSPVEPIQRLLEP